MEAIIFIGLPASGKSTFYKERFFATHVRISRDLLKTPHRCQRLLDLCLETDQRFVADNTHPTAADRAAAIAAAKQRGFTVRGYYFQSRIADCLERNAQREGIERVVDSAILGKAKLLELPTLAEGFDQLFYVRIDGGRFVVEDWQDEIR
jgi:predicted kinase